MAAGLLTCKTAGGWRDEFDKVPNDRLSIEWVGIPDVFLKCATLYNSDILEFVWFGVRLLWLFVNELRIGAALEDAAVSTASE